MKTGLERVEFLLSSHQIYPFQTNYIDRRYNPSTFCEWRPMHISVVAVSYTHLTLPTKRIV